MKASNRVKKSDIKGAQMMLVLSGMEMGIPTAGRNSVNQPLLAKWRQQFKGAHRYAEKPMNLLAYFFRPPSTLEVFQKPRYRQLKFFWALIVLVIWSVLFYDIYEITREYFDEPMGTRSSYESLQLDFMNKNFKFSFCPERWIDQDNVRRLKLTPFDMKYLISYLNDANRIGEAGRNVGYDQMVAKSKRKVRRLVGEFGSLKELYMALMKNYTNATIDKNDVFLVYDGPSTSTICFSLPGDQLQFAPLGSLLQVDSEFTLNLYHDRTYEDGGFLYPDSKLETSYYTHFSGPRMGAITNGLKSVYIFHHSYIRTTVRLRHYKYYNGFKHVCVNNDRVGSKFVPVAYARDICSLECLDEGYYRIPFNCSILPLFDEKARHDDDLEQCNYFESNMDLFFAHNSKVFNPDPNCIPKCNELKFCDEWDIDRTVVDMSEPCKNQSNHKTCETYTLSVWIDNRAELVQEYPIRSFNTVLSDYGGQLGLFVGISIVSVTQLIIHWLSLLMTGLKRTAKTRRNANSRNSGELRANSRSDEDRNGNL